MMENLKELKQRHDLRRIVEADLGPAHCRGPKALLWRCPFHNEHRGYSLAVWEDGWRCFGACSTGGDVLDWLQRYRGMSFSQACEYIGTEQPLEPTVHRHRHERSAAHLTHDARLPNDAWQEAAKHVVETAKSVLWSPAGARALGYLKKRGLTEETIQRARLGYIPGRAWEWRMVAKLNVPCGITIPWFFHSQLWAVKVRRAAGLPKYTQIAGGSPDGLYNAASLDSQPIVLFTEGEFDVLLTEQELGGGIGVATLGSASRTLHPRWLPFLLDCESILVAYDNDQAGMKGAARLQAITKRARVIQVPQGKDVTEFVLKGGSVRQWLNENL